MANEKENAVEERVQPFQSIARSRFVRISPSKVRTVTKLINGKTLDQARSILAFTTKASAHEISKVLESAVANAEHNFQIPQEDLFVKLAKADDGRTLPGRRYRARGSMYRIRKRSSHITIVLERAEIGGGS